MDKPFWESKTIWVNFLTIVAAIIVIPEFNIPAEVVALVLAIVNAILRFMTGKPLKVKSSKLLSILIVVGLLAGCVAHMTPVKQAVVVRNGYNELLEEWIVKRNLVENENTKQKIDNYFVLANAVLRQYERAVLEEDFTTAENKYDEYLKLKRQIENALRKEVLSWMLEPQLFLKYPSPYWILG